MERRHQKVGESETQHSIQPGDPRSNGEKLQGENLTRIGQGRKVSGKTNLNYKKKRHILTLSY